MNETQKTYAALRELLEVKKSQVEEAMNNYDGGKDAEAWVIAQDNEEEKVGYWQTFEALKDAERAMVGWAIETVKSASEYKKHAALFVDLDKRARKFPEMWERLVELCYKLEA